MRYYTFGALVCLAIGLSSAARAQTSDPQLMAPINAFLDAFNKGDVAGAAAAHTATADLVILDEVPPFYWRGPKAVETWATDLDADAKKRGITDPKVTLKAATRTETNGAMAYVIVPATYTFREKGVAMSEAAQMTFILKKEASGWMIQGWTWTGPRPQNAAGPTRK